MPSLCVHGINSCTSPCSCHSDSCHLSDSRSYWQRFWPNQRSSLSCGTRSSSDLRSLGGSHSLGKFLAAPLSLPQQLSLSLRLLLDYWPSLSPQHCSAHLLLHPLVGPAANRHAVDPPLPPNVSDPNSAHEMSELKNYNLQQSYRTKRHYNMHTLRQKHKRAGQ